MTAPLPPQSGLPTRTPARFWPRAALRAVLFGLALGATLPASADNLPDVQRLIKQGQYSQALDKVDSYLSSKPKDAQGRFLRGLILTEMGKPADAIAVFTKLTEDYPELPEPYNNLAVLYAQQKQYDKARMALEMAIRTHPSYAIAYENLGDIYAKMASQAYDKALQIDSGNPAAQNKMALIRDLISISGRANVKPQPGAAVAPAPAPAPAPTPVAKPAPVAAAPAPAPKVVAAAPASAPSATVLTATPGAAAMQQAKPAAEKPAEVVKASVPAPAPASAPAKQDAVTEDIVKALGNWADAWSRKDVKAYLSHYAGDFHPPKGVSRKDWEAERQSRIAGKPGKISVSYDSPQVAVNGDKATVKFRQHYKAGSLNTSTTKTMVFVHAGSKWLIQEENSH